MTNKDIVQNPERYFNEGAKWKISASPNIEPIYLPKGVNPNGLLPVLKVDGVMVEVGGYKLISQNTLDLIKLWNNPHYDIKQNGTIKGVSIGNTIRTLKVNIDTLFKSANERDILNRNAGVTSVDYIYESSMGNMVPGTNLSMNIVDQINYTLSPDYNRPKDTYLIAQLELGPADAYDIRYNNALDKQDLENNVFSYAKLEEYLNAVKEKQINLQKDFSLIKEVFWEGKLPAELTTYKITKMATAEDKTEEGDVQIVYKAAQPILNIVAKPPTNETVQLPKVASSNIGVYAIAGKISYASGVDIWPNDPSTGNKGKSKGKFYSEKRFVGSFHKKFGDNEIWKVYEPDGKILRGYIEAKPLVVVPG